MKILIVVTDMDIGGVTSSAVNLCNELQARGHKVTFLNMAISKWVPSEIEKGVQTMTFDGMCKYWTLCLDDIKREEKVLKKLVLFALGLIKKATNRSDLWFNLIFWGHRQKTKYDVALAYRQSAPCYRYVLKKVEATKKIGFIHGDIAFLGDMSSWDYLMGRFEKVACVSKASSGGLIERYPQLKESVCTIYNMFNSPYMEKMSHEYDPEFNKDCINIVTVSRIEFAQKQIDFIPLICKTMKENTCIKFRWYIVGAGPDMKALIDLIEKYRVTDCVIPVGSKRNPFPYMLEADFSVIPSKWEAYGMVVTESLILKTPVVATAYPALYEILDDGFNGVITSNNRDSLRETVFTLITQRDRLTQLKSNCEDWRHSNSAAVLQFIKAATE